MHEILQAVITLIRRGIVLYSTWCGLFLSVCCMHIISFELINTRNLGDHIDVCMYTTFCSRRGEDIGNCHNYVSWLSFDPARKARGYRKRWSWQLYWVPLSLCILMTSCGGGKWSWIALLLHWTHAPCYYNGATVVPISYIVSWWSTRIYFLPQAAAALYIHLLRRRVQVGSKQ